MAVARPRYLRTAVTPRMLGLLLVLLAIAAVCGWLGAWQLDRARSAQAEEAPDVAPVALAEVLAPQETFTGTADGRLVEVRGRFGADELLVPGRLLEGEPGYAVVTPLTVEGTGATLAVVRGWVPDPAAAADRPAPRGEVVATGVLAVGEAAGDDTALPPGQVAAVSPALLVNRWDGPMYTGYLLLAEVTPGQGDLALIPPEPASGGWDLQNLAYALQWWLFGGFAVLLWARLVRDEARRAAAEGPAGGPPDAVLSPGRAGAGGDASP